jgi:hypothetical protein
MTAAIVCDGEFCNSVFTDRKEFFKVKRLNQNALFCFGCVTQINKEDGWEIKSRDSLERYKKITGQDFVPYEDAGMMDSQETDEQYALEDIYRSLSSFMADEKARLLIKRLEDLIQGDWQKVSKGRKDKLHPYLTPLIKTLESLAESKNKKGL